MNPQDKEAIDNVFNRVSDVGRQGAARDSEAEKLIEDRMRQQPGSAYYLAQTVLIQEQALKNAQHRIDELNSSSPPGFGRHGNNQATPQSDQSSSGFGRSNGNPAGGGFMAGALQTAMGVGGGLLLGNMLGGLFGNSAQTNETQAKDSAPSNESSTADNEAGDDGGGLDEA